MKNTLYVFLDESGNFDFSANGSTYMVFGAVVLRRPFTIYHNLVDARYDLIEAGHDLAEFHAGQDRQAVRDVVFKVISEHINSVVIHSLIVEKSKTDPALHPMNIFYPRMLGYLLRHILNSWENCDELIVVTDEIPMTRKRQAVEKAVKTTLSSMLPDTTPYRVLHHSSKSNVGVQIADYCTWAIARKWKDGDTRSYDYIKKAIKSELDVFEKGVVRHY